MPKLYALFVGLDDYKNPEIPTLKGAVADARAMAAVFAKRMAPADYKPLKLMNEEATRDAIIEQGFRKHLAQAGKNDVALFYFCGHGSQENSPEFFRAIESDHLLETILPYDARTNVQQGGRTTRVFDLADKELRVLIDEVASRGAEVVVIADSCHAAGNSRATPEPNADRIRSRHAPADPNQMRELSQFLPAVQERYTPERLREEGIPTPRLIAIAACQSREKALEMAAPPDPKTKKVVQRGIFSLHLEELIEKVGPATTYQDLITSVQLRIADQLASEQLVQVPDLEVSGGASKSQLFLRGTVARLEIRARADKTGQWWITRGALDGLPEPASGAETTVDLYPLGAFDDDQEPTPLASASVITVQQDMAQIAFDSDAKALDPQQEYIARITRIGSPALDVIVEVPGNADAAVREAADQLRSRLNSKHPMIAVTDKPTRAAVVRAKVSVTDVALCDAKGTPYPGLSYTLDPTGLERFDAEVDHLASWFRARDLRPKGSRLNDVATINLIMLGDKGSEREKQVDENTPPEAEKDGVVTLRYTADKTGARVKMRVQHTNSDPLYVAVIQLKEDFSIRPAFEDEIPPGNNGYFDGGKAWRFAVPAWKGDASSSTSIFKTIVSTSKFNADRWSLPTLLDRDAPITRDGGPEADDEAAVGAWGVSTMRVTVVREPAT